MLGNNGMLHGLKCFVYILKNTFPNMFCKYIMEYTIRNTYV